MLTLVLLCVLVGLLILGLYSFKEPVGFLFLAVFVASVQYLQNEFALTLFLRLGSDIVVSPGSAVLFPATFLVLLLLATRESIADVRRLIYAVLAANLLLTLIGVGVILAVNGGYLESAPAIPGWLGSFSFQTYLIGTGLLVVDAFLLIVLFETLLRLRIPLLLRAIGSLVAVLAFDSIAFILLAADLPMSALPGHLIGKTTAGVTYGALLTGYLYAAGPPSLTSVPPAGSRFEWLDVFSILRYRERYRDLRKQSRQKERQANQQIGLLLDNTAEAIVGLDRSGRCTFSNPAARRLLGYASGDRLAGRSFHELAHPPGFAPSSLPMEECPMCSVAVTGEAHSGEDLQLQRTDGTIFQVEYWAHPIHQNGGVVGSVVTFLDVTERKRAETKLQSLERRYRDLFRDAPEMYVLTSNTESGPLINECSDSFLTTLGYELEEVVGRPLADFYTEHSRRLLLEGGGYENALKGKLSRSERELVSRAGEIHQTMLRAAPELDAAGRAVGTRAIYVNITERKRAEVLVQQSRERLRHLAERLQTVREEERKSLARLMHDELGQTLTAMRLDLLWIQPRIEGDEPLAERAQAMLGILDRMIDTVRDLSARLRPHVLDSLGLAAAVAWEAEQCSDRSALSFLVETASDNGPVDSDLDADRSIALFRIFQEAITNIIRHAEAKQAQVYLRRSATDLQLEVLDDGKGIRDKEIWSVGSSGLIGMRERVGALGGSFEIGRRAAGGTRLSVRIPL